MPTLRTTRQLAFTVLLLVSPWLSPWSALPASASTATTTALTLTQNGKPVTSITPGTVVTMTATVTAGGAPVTQGTVDFCNAKEQFCTDVHLVGTAQLTSAGTATVRFAPPGGGQQYKAVFVGTLNDAGSTSATVDLSVLGLMNSFTTISATGNANDYNLTATVGGICTTPPTGPVDFLNRTDGNLQVGRGILGNGVSGLNFLNYSTTSMYVPAAGSGTAVPNGVVVGDFNQDGNLDIAFTVFNGTNTFVTLLGNGTGSFVRAATDSVTASSVTQYAIAIATGDFNNDGIPDVALLGVSPQGDGVQILLGNGNGTFQAATPDDANQVQGATSFTVGDFNRDGNLDIAVAFVGANGASQVQVLLGLGNGQFNPELVEPFVGVGATSIVTADFNSDGFADLAVANSDSVVVLLGNGDGTFTAVPANSATTGITGPLVVADFNLDGHPDLAGSSANGKAITVLLGNGNGTFAAASSTISAAAAGMKIADPNGDGVPDLATFAGTSFTPWLGKGDGTFIASASTNTDSADTADTIAVLGVADFNNDGRQDVVVGDALQTAPVYLTANQMATTTVTGVTLAARPPQQSITANYLGDDNYYPSVSSPILLPPSTLAVSPLQIIFPETHVGAVSAYEPITLTNNGPTIDISSIAIANPSSLYSFGIRAQTCGSTLAAGASCTFDVVFRPTDDHSPTMTATVSISDDAYGTPQQVALTGFVYSAPELKFSTASLTFPATYIGDTAAYQYVTVKNLGQAPASLSSIAITNTGSFYSWGIRENTCGPSIVAGGECSFAVAFRPTGLGPITADVTLTDNAIGSPQRISLIGVGK